MEDAGAGTGEDREGGVMPKQIFEIWRPPEARPVTAKELRHWLWVTRREAEWEVREQKEIGVHDVEEYYKD